MFVVVDHAHNQHDARAEIFLHVVEKFRQALGVGDVSRPRKNFTALGTEFSRVFVQKFLSTRDQHHAEIFTASKSKNFSSEVAKRGSVTKTANELYVSQPAVTKAVKNLERRLNLKLFHRDRRRGLILTDAGEKIFCSPLR